MLVVIVLVPLACIPILPAADNQSSDIVDGISADTNSLPWSTHTGEIGNDVSTIVDGNNTFSCDLYQQFIQSMEEENFMYSPYSIYLALAMAYAGAGGDTARQMADTLHFGLAGDKVNSALSDLSNIIDKSQTVKEYHNPDGTVEEVVEKFQLNIANALWGQQGYGFLADYLAIIDEYYNGAFKEMDFKNQPEPSRLEINDWIAEKTQDRILDMIPPNAINKSTRFVITNAIYFKARWYDEFSESRTKYDDFFLLDGTRISVPMMHNTIKTLYFENEDYQMVRIGYIGGCSMLIILPREGKFEAVEQTINSSLLKTAINSTESYFVNLDMPKFGYYSKYEKLRSTLSELGIQNAFSGKADFSGITAQELYINRVAHDAFIAVDEEGTEAAAATAITTVGAAPLELETADFTANRPFIYFIQHYQTGAILFMGRVMNPAAN